MIKQVYAMKDDQPRDIFDVLVEIEILSRDGQLDYIVFADGYLPIYNLGWLSEFCNQYGVVNIPFSCSIMASDIRQYNIKMLSEIGLHSVIVIVQVDDDHEKLHRNAMLLHQYGIKFALELECSPYWEMVIKKMDVCISCYPVMADVFYVEHPRRPMDYALPLVAPVLQRLQKLFSLAVNKPAWRKWLWLLCRLPLDGLYDRIYKNTKPKLSMEMYKIEQE